MQLVVETLLATLPQVGVVMLFGAFLFTIFSILGVQLFAGRFSRCNQVSLSLTEISRSKVGVAEGLQQLETSETSVGEFRQLCHFKKKLRCSCLHVVHANILGVSGLSVVHAIMHVCFGKPVIYVNM